MMRYLEAAWFFVAAARFGYHECFETRTGPPYGSGAQAPTAIESTENDE